MLYEVITLMGVLLLKKEQVLHGQIKQVAAADELENYEPHEMRGKDQGDQPKSEGTDDAVKQGLFLPVFGEVANQDGQDQSVVDGQRNNFV